MIAARRIELELHCDVLPIDVPSDVSPLVRSVTEKCGVHVLDAAFLAATDDRILLSDDLYYRQFAAQSCGANRSLWLQAALNAAQHRGLLSGSAYADAVIGLAMCGHSHLALNDGMLVDVLRLDDTAELFKFSVVAEFIGTKTAEIKSHVTVAAAFLQRVWGMDVAEIKKAKASGILLENLLRHRQGDHAAIIEYLQTTLHRNFRAAQYLEGWCRGHFLTR